MFWHLELADPGEAAPPKSSQVLEIIKDLPVNVPVTLKPTNPKAKHPTTSFTEPLYSSPYPSDLITP